MEEQSSLDNFKEMVKSVEKIIEGKFTNSQH